MGKRRKPGNINPKKQLKKQGTAYYNREQEINYLLNKFTNAVYNPNFNLQNIKSYKQMNEIRMKLKKLFDQQGDIVWKKVLRDVEYMMSNYQNLKLYIPDGKVKLILLI
ncbi:hypothetical protein [Methanobrevibacter smithii]|uniref:hypothetical protein n=1 Tax=Methanobrevibacter smithii TaxID=2173 RepID=UPI0026713822|nr:hypothetical protein [Methanobrevibacter smithii]